MNRLSVVAAAGAVVLAIGGCASDGSAAGDDRSTQEPVDVDVTISNGHVDPLGERVEVDVDQPVRLHVDSDAADQLHVHSDPEHEFEVDPGKETYRFSVGTPGQVAVELHGLDETVAQLLVRP